MSYPNLVTSNSISEILDLGFNKMKNTALFLHEIEKNVKRCIINVIDAVVSRLSCVLGLF